MLLAFLYIYFSLKFKWFYLIYLHVGCCWLLSVFFWNSWKFIIVIYKLNRSTRVSNNFCITFTPSYHMRRSPLRELFEVTCDGDKQHRGLTISYICVNIQNIPSLPLLSTYMIFNCNESIESCARTWTSHLLTITIHVISI